MNENYGRDTFLSLLEDEGVTHIFGNPGTTELAIMHALNDHPDLTYVLGLQEAVVVAMADGYAGEQVGPDDATALAAGYLNMRKLSIYGGSNEIQKNIIAQMILGL